MRIAFSLIALLFGSVPATEPTMSFGFTGPTIDPNPAVQSELDVLAATKEHTLDRAQELIAIWQMIRDHRTNIKQLALQAALYDSQHPRAHVLVSVAPIAHSDGPTLEIWLLPYYNSADPQLREIVGQNVGFASNRENRPTNAHDERASTVCHFLIGDPKPLPAEVIQNLFGASPSTAVIELSRSWFSTDLKKFREVLWGEHMIADIIWKRDDNFLQPGDEAAGEAELDKLSKFDEWWVRLYAAEILSQCDDIFDAPAARDRLQRDSNPLIVQAINTINHHGMTEEEEKAAWQRAGYPNGRPSTAPLKRILGK